MLILTSTSDALRVKLSATVTTNQLQCVCAYRDTTATDITPGNQLTVSDNTTQTSIVSSPASGTQRIIEYVSVFNTDTASAEVTISAYDGTNYFTLFKCTLAPGEKLEYQHGSGWQVFTTTGSLKQSLNQGAAPVTSGDSISVLASDVTNNNATANTIADVTGLSFAVTSGNTYYFRFVIRYTSAAATTGSRWSISGPTFTELAYRADTALAATTGTIGNNVDYDLPAASNATSASTAGNMVAIFGFITPSANGSVIARFASEVSSSAIVAKAGSFVQYRQVL